MKKLSFAVLAMMSLGYAQLVGGLIPFDIGRGISGENKKDLDVNVKLGYTCLNFTKRY
jgi:hypothetical protein